MNQAKMAQKQAELAKNAVNNPEHRFSNLYALMHWGYWIVQAAQAVLKRPGSDMAGVDGQTKDAFKKVFKAEISGLVDELKRKTYVLHPVRSTFIQYKTSAPRTLVLTALQAEMYHD